MRRGRRQFTRGDILAMLESPDEGSDAVNALANPFALQLDKQKQLLRAQLSGFKTKSLEEQLMHIKKLLNKRAFMDVAPYDGGAGGGRQYGDLIGLGLNQARFTDQAYYNAAEAMFNQLTQASRFMSNRMVPLNPLGGGGSGGGGGSQQQPQQPQPQPRQQQQQHPWTQRQELPANMDTFQMQRMRRFQDDVRQTMLAGGNNQGREGRWQTTGQQIGYPPGTITNNSGLEAAFGMREWMMRNRLVRSRSQDAQMQAPPQIMQNQQNQELKQSLTQATNQFEQAAAKQTADQMMQMQTLNEAQQQQLAPKAPIQGEGISTTPGNGFGDNTLLDFLYEIQHDPQMDKAARNKDPTLTKWDQSGKFFRNRDMEEEKVEQRKMEQIEANKALDPNSLKLDSNGHVILRDDPKDNYTGNWELFRITKPLAQTPQQNHPPNIMSKALLAMNTAMEQFENEDVEELLKKKKEFWEE